MVSTNKTLVAVCVLVFLCGLSIGIFSSSWILQTDSEHDLKTIANLSDAAYDAYSKRDQVASKKLLLDFLNALNSSIESNKAKRKALLLDKALTSGRLALLAEKSGNATEKDAFFELSIASCLEANSEKCTEIGIRERLQRIYDSMRNRMQN